MNAYRPNETNICPGCGRSQWIVGRITAECAFCSTALPLAEGHRPPDIVRVVHAPRVSRSSKRPGPARHLSRAVAA